MFCVNTKQMNVSDYISVNHIMKMPISVYYTHTDYVHNLSALNNNTCGHHEHEEYTETDVTAEICKLSLVTVVL